jgi:hypothetical protein
VIDLATTGLKSRNLIAGANVKCLIMQYGETTCCQRRPGRADDDEGNDLLLNSDRGAGGVVVSKEEVALGRKGSGGAWGMGVDQPECGAGS